jgi:hypothetical protein
MPRLNQRTDGSGYYITNAFSRNGVIKFTTYQPSDRAIEILADRGVRSGDEFPKELFFELLEEEELTTGGSGLGGGTDDDVAGNHWRPTPEERENRRQIPLDVTTELLNQDGTFISFGRFMVQYGGRAGYEDDVLRPAYRTLNKKYQAGLPQQLDEILSGHRPTSIKREADQVIVELVRR